MHWCMDETLAVLAMIPFIGFFFAKIHAWWHKHFHHKCHEEGCGEEHVEHPAPAHFTEEDMKFFINTPAPRVTNPMFTENELTWDPIEQEDLEERVGRELILDLKDHLRTLRAFSYTDDMEYRWWINDLMEVKAEVGGRTFVHDYACCEHGWDEVM